MNALKLVAVLGVMFPLLLAAQDEIELPSENAARALSKELVAAAETARQEYRNDLSHVPAETARSRYVESLTEIAYRYMEISKGFAWKYLQTGWEALNAEIDRYPAPKSSDSKALSRLLIGKWESPQHEYEYRKGDYWRINGNQFRDNNKGTYTIFLLNKKYFVFSDEVNGNGVYFEKRLSP